MNKDEHYMQYDSLTEQGIVNLFTFKPYNFRKEFVSEEEISNYYKKLEEETNYKFEKIVSPNQTHTNVVKVVTLENINDNFNNVDGLITNLKNVSLVTKVADCQSILLFDKENMVIGNIHSGWKGTLNRIVKKAILLMISEFNSKPENIQVYINPSILKCCFEVDEDIKKLFIEQFKDIDINSCINTGKIINNKQKYYIDTVKINELVLLNLGIKKENITLSNICSKCNKHYIHSHRGDGVDSGRNIALICIKN